MNLEQIASESTNSSASQFWRAIAIWMRNPHVINRRILHSEELLVIEVSRNVTDIFERIEKLQIQSNHFECDSPSESAEHLLDALNVTKHCQLSQFTDSLEALNDNKVYMRVTKLLPRNMQLFSSTLKFVLVNKKSANVVSLQKPIDQNKRSLGPKTVYSIQYHECSTSISIRKSDDEYCGRDCEWLKSKFLPRLIKWMVNENVSSSAKISSLSLVSIEKYTSLYNQLKRKYGAEMVKVWPENTDPAKFVYEDIAIATYLLLLWERERLEKGTQELQSFVDLGCGNGLLVYILSSEGHAGRGIDLRRRMIWNLYPESTRLQVSSIIPSSSTVFPEVDWIIGNHSDELTPWIPVIAARSSYECRFFLLPCCAYEFDGSKYRRCNAAKSQYAEYMSYVKSVCEGCGFHTLVDRLRIPSTKRICFVGWQRTYAKENTASLDDEIRKIVDARSTTVPPERSAKPGATEGTDQARELWSANFRPRCPTEQTRNCTQLDRELILDIVNVVAAHLLQGGRRIPSERQPGATWNAGRQISIGEVAGLIAPEKLQQLRNECGGLQTLLKNQNNIFCVAQGKVQFRNPGAVDRRKRNKRKWRHGNAPLRKVKPCWFHKNHPDGCPALEADCDFQH